MSREWLTQLKQASAQLDEELIMELLNQIPHEQTFLAEALQNKVDDFDFEEIINGSSDLV